MVRSFSGQPTTLVIICRNIPLTPSDVNKNPGGLLGLICAGYVPLASESRYPIIIYFVANYRPYLSHF